MKSFWFLMDIRQSLSRLRIRIRVYQAYYFVISAFFVNHCSDKGLRIIRKIKITCISNPAHTCVMCFTSCFCIIFWFLLLWITSFQLFCTFLVLGVATGNQGWKPICFGKFTILFVLFLYITDNKEHIRPKKPNAWSGRIRFPAPLILHTPV